MLRMVERVQETSSDPALHGMIYSYLLDADASLLLSLKSVYVETFLKTNKPSLLYKYVCE